MHPCNGMMVILSCFCAFSVEKLEHNATWMQGLTNTEEIEQNLQGLFVVQFNCIFLVCSRRSTNTGHLRYTLYIYT